MKTLKRTTLLLTALLGMAIFSTTTQAADAPAAEATDATSAVTCDKCKTVWVQRATSAGPIGRGGNFYALTNEQKMQCADCESAVVTFFKTGKLKHDCAKCAGTLSHCTKH